MEAKPKGLSLCCATAPAAARAGGVHEACMLELRAFIVTPVLVAQFVGAPSFCACGTGLTGMVQVMLVAIHPWDCAGAKQVCSWHVVYHCASSWVASCNAVKLADVTFLLLCTLHDVGQHAHYFKWCRHMTKSAVL